MIHNLKMGCLPKPDSDRFGTFKRGPSLSRFGKVNTRMMQAEQAEKRAQMLAAIQAGVQPKIHQKAICSRWRHVNVTSGALRSRRKYDRNAKTEAMHFSESVGFKLFKTTRQ